jgi:hypothetical protein
VARTPQSYISLKLSDTLLLDLAGHHLSTLVIGADALKLLIILKDFRLMSKGSRSAGHRLRMRSWPSTCALALWSGRGIPDEKAMK